MSLSIYACVGALVLLVNFYSDNTGYLVVTM